MKYINKKTQAVIETACVISGGDWEKVEPVLEKPEEPVKARRKKGDK